jgi:hypothetical protein
VRESMENVIKTHSRNQITDNENRIWLSVKIPPIRVDMHTGENWVLAKG